MTPILDGESTPPAAPAEDEVLVTLADMGAARRDLGEAVLEELTADRRLLALESRAERDGYASVSLWPARFPNFALEVRHGDGEPTSYWQTGSAFQLISRGRALGLLRLFAATLREGGAA